MRREASLQRRVNFLRHAGAIALAPEYYADWLLAYLKVGGTVRQGRESYPFMDGVDRPFEKNGYWLLTNQDLRATDMPAGFGSDALQVFPEHGLKMFARQFLVATAEKQGKVMPEHARRETLVGPYFASGAETAYGESSVYLPAQAGNWERRGYGLHRRPYVSRPNAVVLHPDQTDYLYVLAHRNRFVTAQLDMILAQGHNLPPTITKPADSPPR